MSRRTTLKDIAVRAGVHVSTASRALDPKARKKLTPEVAQRVTEVARELGYRPNRIAVGLRTNRSMTVGIVIPDIANALFPPILRGAESVLEPAGYAAIIVNTDNLPERETRLMDVLIDRGVDGILHAAPFLDDPQIGRATSSGVPVVTLNRRLESHMVPSVIHDETAGISLIVRHLASLGHRRLAHIAGPQDTSTGRARLRAFLSACSENGLETRNDSIQFAKRFDVAEGYLCARAILETGKSVTAILCANDLLAIGAINCHAERGYPCPQGISVTGFNDMPSLEFLKPGLTTVRVQKFNAGAIAARLLLDRMVGDEAGECRHEVLPVRVVVRESTGPPRLPGGH